MSFFTGMDIAASGMTAQRFRLDIITQNLANADTTRTPEGGPYQRQTVLFESIPMHNQFNTLLQNELNSYAPTQTNDKQGFYSGFKYMDNMYNSQGVQVAAIVKDQTPMPVIYDPTHPDADAEGYVTMPNVNTVTEMVNMISASRSYEANVTAFNNLKAMNTKALEIGK